MERDYTDHFTETPEASFSLIHKITECREFLVYGGTVFCLTNRDTLMVPSEGEEYEFYGNILKMAIYGHYIYLIFESSKILVFDILSREVVTNFPGICNKVKRVRVADSGIYFLCDDGYLYKSSFENLRYVRQEPHIQKSSSKASHSVVLNFGVCGDSIFFTTSVGGIYKNSELILKIFDTAALLAPCKEYLYVLTGRGLLIKYNLIESKVAFKLDMGKAKVVGDFCIMHDSMIIDLSNETWTRVPKDMRSFSKINELLYIQTSSGIWGN